MKVLSLFDGLSCGQIALNRIGVKPEAYYSAEVDKYAIKVTQANYPDTVQLGDVTKWREWNINWASIDLLIGGSPCQGFSFAGKQLAFDDSRSKLFFVYVDILNHIKSVNPNVKFMLENVKMKKDFLAVISEHLGVEPVFIDSQLLSAQRRQRYYWCNWKVEQPEDRGVVLADILECNKDWLACVVGTSANRDVRQTGDKSGCLTANYYKGVMAAGRPFLATRSMVGERLDTKYQATVQKDNLVQTVTFNDRIKGVTQDERGIRYNKGDKAKSGISELGRILKPEARYTDAITTSHMPKLALNEDVANLRYRKLTPIECERLQTVPDNYTNHVSNTQRYKMLGNGWTIDVIAHIFSQGFAKNNSDTATSNGIVNQD